MIELSAIVACTVLAGLFILQILLILGVPLGRFAWGGQHSVLPKNLRIASVSSLFLYITFAVFVLSKAEVIGLVESESVLSTFMWIFTGYFFLGIFMNAASRSKHERLLMTPVALILALLFLVVSLG
jgi:hypothetical protein